MHSGKSMPGEINYPVLTLTRKEAPIRNFSGEKNRYIWVKN
jgi:hypothetical protein